MHVRCVDALLSSPRPSSPKQQPLFEPPSSFNPRLINTLPLPHLLTGSLSLILVIAIAVDTHARKNTQNLARCAPSISSTISLQAHLPDHTMLPCDFTHGLEGQVRVFICGASSCSHAILLLSSANRCLETYIIAIHSVNPEGGIIQLIRDI